MNKINSSILGITNSILKLMKKQEPVRGFGHAKTPNNALFTIRPYKEGSTWFFNDARVGVTHEALVLGTSEAVDMLIEKVGLNKLKAEKVGFNLTFSSEFIPNNHGEFDWVKTEYGWNTYYWKEKNHTLSLCPVFTRFYPIPPKKLYALAQR